MGSLATNFSVSFIAHLISTGKHAQSLMFLQGPFLLFFKIGYLKGFIENTACARNSLLYGLVGGMTVGTSKFMYSSK